MARATTTPPDRAKRPRDGRRPIPEPRYEPSDTRAERRRPQTPGTDAEPRLGPYEFRYSIDFGYSSPALG